MAFLALLIALLGLAPGALAAPQNLVTVQGSPAALEAGKPGKLQITLVIPPGYHVYNDNLHIETLDAAGLTLGPPSLPPGISKPDPSNPAQTREQYEFDAIVEIPATAVRPGSAAPSFSVRFFACKATLCFIPKTEQVTIPVTIAGSGGSGDGGAMAAPAAGPAGLALTAAPARPDVSFAGLPPAAEARKMDGDKPHPVVARLLADQQAVAPGGTVRLGVHLEQADGWHTYWRSPGAVGKPPEITWTLPGGATASPAAFPVPERFETEGLVSYGYDHENLVFSSVTLPAEMQPGAYEIKADVRWLVCEKQCIPGSASLVLPITVAASAQPSPFAPLFDYFAARHPLPPTALGGVQVEAALSVPKVRQKQPFQATILLTPPAGKRIEIQQTAGAWPAFAPIAEGNYEIKQALVQPTEAGGVLVTIAGETYELFEGDPLPDKDVIGGLLQFTLDGQPMVTEVTVPVPWEAGQPELAALPAGPEAVKPVADAIIEEGGNPGRPSFLGALVLAFLGGIVLNVMPCVLPVLTLKLYSLVGQQDSTARHRQEAGLAYSAGIVLSFVALAGVVVALKAAGVGGVGWGFQFQYPGYVAGLATVVFVFGLSLFGVFEVPTPGANAVAQASTREGMAGYFLTGVFATLLATPCSAPFLGTGMGFAFSLPAAGILLFFAAAGLGLALPFLLIAFVPALMRFLPRPGAWMESFKQFLGFTLVATTVWLVDVLGAQVGRDGQTSFLVFLLFVGVGAWIFGRWGGPVHSPSRQLVVLGAAAVIALNAWILFVDLEPEAAAASAAASAAPPKKEEFSEDIPWRPFSDAQLAATAGHPVFVDFTAEWCLTCKANEKTILDTKTVRGCMAEAGIVPLKADWTNQNPEITAWIERYQRAGVPFYLVFHADRAQDPILLPEVITPGMVNGSLAKVSPAAAAACEG